MVHSWQSLFAPCGVEVSEREAEESSACADGKTIQSDISRRRPFAGAALYERRNPPIADRRTSFRASTTYVVMYNRP